MKPERARQLQVCLFLIATLTVEVVPAGHTSPALRIELRGDTLLAHSVTPGGVLYVVGASREVIEPYRSPQNRPRQERLDIERMTVIHTSGQDHDHDGRLSVELDRPIRRGVIAAVDLSSGQHAMTPIGVGPRPFHSAVKVDPSTGTLSLGLRRALVLWLRPGLGAWLAQVQDGAPKDLDRHRLRSLRWPLAALLPWPALDEEPVRLDRLDPSDRLVVVDLESMTIGFFALENQEETP